MKLAVIGVTGLVGQAILEVLEERNFSVDRLLLVASEASVGKRIVWRGEEHEVMSMKKALAASPTLAIFATGEKVSSTWVPRFVDVGTTVIDHSTTWRMDPNCKLIVPEVNGCSLRPEDKIIANPNCSTIQLVMAMAPLHKCYGLDRLVVATYQAVTGSGKAGVSQLLDERRGCKTKQGPYPHEIDLNVIPHIDAFLENGYTREEMKVVNETRKILDDDSIGLSVTAVRVPVLGGHSLAVNAAFRNEFVMEEVSRKLYFAIGLVLEDDLENCRYPMPRYVERKNDVFVGRLRRDTSQKNTIDMWIVADNLRKGAATNSVDIACWWRAMMGKF